MLDFVASVLATFAVQVDMVKKYENGFIMDPFVTQFFKALLLCHSCTWKSLLQGVEQY